MKCNGNSSLNEDIDGQFNILIKKCYMNIKKINYT